MDPSERLDSWKEIAACPAELDAWRDSRPAELFNAVDADVVAPTGTPVPVVALVGTRPPLEGKAVTQMSDAARAELAPNGRLRAALNYSNTLLVSTRSPEHAGVAPDLARELARRAGATVEFIGYANAGLVADAAANNAWDVAFIGAEPQRAGAISFSPAYVEIEATYLVQPSSSLRRIDEVDRDGIHIVTASRAAYTLFLQRTLRHAALVEAESLPAAFDLFVEKKFEVLAGLKPNLMADAKRVPGARLLEGRFTAVQQAIGVPRKREAAAAYLAAFAKEIVVSGLLRDLIARHHADGLSIVRG